MMCGEEVKEVPSLARRQAGRGKGKKLRVER